MNILSHIIIEVHGIKKLGLDDLIEVDVTCACYGTVARFKHTTTQKQWEHDLERGFFMA